MGWWRWWENRSITLKLGIEIFFLSMYSTREGIAYLNIIIMWGWIYIIDKEYTKAVSDANLLCSIRHPDRALFRGLYVERVIESSDRDRGPEISSLSLGRSNLRNSGDVRKFLMSSHRTWNSAKITPKLHQNSSKLAADVNKMSIECTSIFLQNIRTLW